VPGNTTRLEFLNFKFVAGCPDLPFRTELESAGHRQSSWV